MNRNVNYNMYPNQYQSNYYPNYYGNNQVKKKRIWPFIVIPILVFVVLIVVGMVLLFTQLKKTAKYLDGEWECDSNETISFNASDNTFKIYDLNSATKSSINGEYKVVGYHTRFKNGSWTYGYTTLLDSKMYDIRVYGSQQDLMDLYDLENREIYQCKKLSDFA